ncbi:MAG: energy transducer TonB [Terricaulis sp.]|nr:energy transducer TonB [Terricaulis sp.]
MSENPNTSAPKPAPKPAPRDKETGGETGGGGKWLLGAAAAIVLIGGGYAVVQNFSQPQEQTESAFNTPADSYGLSEVSPAEETRNQDLAALDSPQAEPAAATPAAPTRRAAPQRTEPVPEATIGITPASATTNANDDEIVVTARRPVWASTPSPRRLSAMYPERALERGQEGEARLACVVQARGALNCEQVEASPGGFGNAALRVARTFRHADTLANGQSAEGTPLNLRVVFQIADEDRGRRFAAR